MRRLFATLGVAMLLMVGTAPAAQAQTDGGRVGTTAMSYLQIGVGARGVAMGETAVAHGADLSSLYWNPALAAGLGGGQAYFAYTDWIAGVALTYGSVMFDLGGMGQVAASVYVMNSGEMEVTTEILQDGTGERFEVQDVTFGVTYSRALTDRFAIGGTAKLIRSSIYNMAASTGAVDIGLTYRTPFDPVTLGLSISNFGGEMQLSGPDTIVRVDLDPEAGGNNGGILGYLATGEWDLPVTFRIGLAYEAIQSRTSSLTLSTDALYPNSNLNYLNTGVEYGFMDTFFVRGGYRQLFLEDREGGLSAGVGLSVRSVFADYAFSDRGDLGAVHFLSMGVAF
jgi:hypothetical protein